MRSLTVHIPQPCHERWNAMQPTEQGRICASCQKAVVDYTALSDQELVKRLSKSAGSGCGRFRDDQLNRQIMHPRSVATSIWQRCLGLLTMGLLGWQSVRAQDNSTKQLSKATSNAVQQPVLSNQEIAVIPARTSIGESMSEWVFKGRVVLMDSSGSLLPMPDAMVSVAYNNSGNVTRSGKDGEFTLKYRTAVPDPLVDIMTIIHGYRGINQRFTLSHSNKSIALGDIVVSAVHVMKPVSITGGMMAITKAPSRWQKLKQKLFR